MAEIVLLNTKLLREIKAMDAEALWQFLLEHIERVLELWNNGGHSYVYYCLGGGFWHFRRCIFDNTEYETDRDELDSSLIQDFCFEGERIKLGYYGTGGFYDHGDSCEVGLSEDLMPPIEEDSDYHHRIEFWLLGENHLRHIIEAMEKNVKNLKTNTREDIKKIKQMRRKCLKNDYYKVAYINYEE